MLDELLEEKELRVADARRKLEWFMEEGRELQSLPPFREYYYLRTKESKLGLSPEETARKEEIRNMHELGLHFSNIEALYSAFVELRAANNDLEAYRKNIVFVWPSDRAIASNGESTDEEPTDGEYTAILGF